MTRIRCSSGELSRQLLSSEDTCWLDVGQHVETGRLEFDKHHVSDQDKKERGCDCDRPNKPNSVIREKISPNLLLYTQITISAFTFETSELKIVQYFHHHFNLLIIHWING